MRPDVCAAGEEVFRREADAVPGLPARWMAGALAPGRPAGGRGRRKSPCGGAAFAERNAAAAGRGPGGPDRSPYDALRPRRAFCVRYLRCSRLFRRACRFRFRAAAAAGLFPRRRLGAGRNRQLRPFLRRTGGCGACAGAGRGLQAGARTPFSAGVGRLHAGRGDGPAARLRMGRFAGAGLRRGRQLGRKPRVGRCVAPPCRGPAAAAVAGAVLPRGDGPGRRIGLVEALRAGRSARRDVDGDLLLGLCIRPGGVSARLARRGLRRRTGRLPPLLLVAAGRDILRDQGEAFAERLLRLGVAVRREELAGAVHLFVTVPGQERAFRRAVALAREFLAG